MTSCSNEGNGQLGYKETKTMVLDILKSEEAQETIEKAAEEKRMKASSNDKLQQLLSSPHGQQIQEAVKNVLTDPNYSKQLEKLMTDPKFAGEFAKAVQKENKQIHIQLMKDPEYQTLMLDLMKSSDYEKMVIDILKGKEYRQEAMTVFEDALKNPLFRLELIELMKKAIEEESKSEEQSESKNEEGSDDSIGDEKK